MPPKFKRNADYSGAGQAERTALLDDHSDDDDFFLRGPSAQPSRLMEDGKVARLQGQVNDVVGVMKGNISKVMERGERLEDLQDKSDDLASSADRFRVHARGLKSSMWWRECKMRILLAVLVIVILLIIIIPIIVKSRK